MDAIPGDRDPALAQASIRGWTGLILSLLGVQCSTGLGTTENLLEIVGDSPLTSA